MEMVFTDKAAAQAATIPVTTNAVRLVAYDATVDPVRGGASYKFVASQPSHSGKFQSANNRWFELAELEQHTDMFGIARDGTGDATAALNAARLCAYLTGDRILRLGPGIYNVSDTVLIGNGTANTDSDYQNCGLVGGGHAYLTAESATTIKWVGADNADKAVVEVAGRISGVKVGGFRIDCAAKARDGLVLRSVYGSHFFDIWARDFRRDGIKITTQTGGTAQWYSSFNMFERLVSTSDHVEQSGAYQTCAWYISGANTTAGAWGNTYIGCRGSVFRDASAAPTELPRVLYLGYTDSSTFVECDFTLTWSGKNGTSTVTGTPTSPAGTGRGAVYDGKVKDQFPMNMMFYGCSIVGPQEVLEKTDEPKSQIGSVIFTNQTTRDWESPPTHPKIRGFNDQGHYFGEIPVAVRGDGKRLRFYQQDLNRWVDFINNTETGGNFTEFLIQYRNAAESEIPAIGINAAGEAIIHQGLRSFHHTINNDAVVSFTPPRSEGTLALTRLAAVTQNAIVAYDALATPNCVAMATGGSANVVCTTGALTGTTGAAGRLTISTASDGNIYIENRTGATIAVRGTYLS